MDKDQVFSKQLVGLLIIVFSLILVTLFLLFPQKADGKLHLIFCDVGQGDGILVKTPKGQDILIDSGPDNSILSCLGKYLTFYDRNIELAVLTHPQSDHMTGFISVFKNYQVDKFLKTAAVNKTAEFEAFKNGLENEKSAQIEAVSSNQIKLENNLIAKILWPRQRIIPDQVSDLNETSIVLRIEYGNFCVLLTGDTVNTVWLQLLPTGDLRSCFLLKVAHHGSKNATDYAFLDAVSPKLAVISVGTNNRYGHPHKEVLQLLNQKGTKVLRTDQLGSIEIITDGKSVETRAKMLK